MRYCPKCFTELPEKANYCPTCGECMREVMEYEAKYLGEEHTKMIVTSLKDMAIRY